MKIASNRTVCTLYFVRCVEFRLRPRVDIFPRNPYFSSHRIAESLFWLTTGGGKLKKKCPKRKNFPKFPPKKYTSMVGAARKYGVQGGGGGGGGVGWMQLLKVYDEVQARWVRHQTTFFSSNVIKQEIKGKRTDRTWPESKQSQWSIFDNKDSGFVIFNCDCDCHLKLLKIFDFCILN